MTPNVRIFASVDAAREADQLLAEKGYRDRLLILPAEVAGREAEAVEKAIKDGFVPGRYVKICTRGLREGYPVLGVIAPFGAGETAINLMQTRETVYADLMRRYRSNDAAPLSDALGIATVVNFTSSSSLISSRWSFTGGFMPLLSNSPAPLSSLLSLPTLTRPKKTWRSSFGFPLLSRNPAPLSSLFALPTLSRPKGKRDWRSSFGLPLIVRNPAPLSSLFGIKTIIKDRREQD